MIESNFNVSNANNTVASNSKVNFVNNSQAEVIPIGQNAEQEPKYTGVNEYVIEQGNTLYSLAKSNGVTVQDILMANPEIANPDNIQAGQKIKLPFIDKKLEQKREMALMKIEEAKNQGYDEYFEFSMDAKHGNVVITLKKEMTLSAIKEKLGIVQNHLREANPKIEKNYKPIPVPLGNTDAVLVPSYDPCKAKAGETFVIDPEKFNVKINIMKKVKDGIKSLFN